MIVLMRFGAAQEQVDAVCAAIRAKGLEPMLLPGDHMAIGIPSLIPPELRSSLEGILGTLPGVSRVQHVSRPYKLASMEWKRQPTTVTVKGVKFGPGQFTVIGGPCSIESCEQFSNAAKIVKAAGARVVRGGAFKPRTSPYAFQGLAEEGLKIMKHVGDEEGLVTVSEVMSGEAVAMVAKYVDILQIGA